MTDEPKRGRGRPRADDPWMTLQVRLRASDLERIKSACPPLTPSEWARHTLLKALVTPFEPTPSQLAPVKRETELKIQKAMDGVPFGPVRAKPSARLKVSKRNTPQ